MKMTIGKKQRNIYQRRNQDDKTTSILSLEWYYKEVNKTFNEPVIEENGDGTVYISQDILLYDGETGKSINAVIQIPRATYDENGNLFMLVVPDE